VAGRVDRRFGDLPRTLPAGVQESIKDDAGQPPPIREYYLAGRRDTPDAAQWRTEIGWPIFRTAAVPRHGEFSA
jgi:hypothetical protein